MGVTWRRVLRVSGVLAFSAVLTASCASPRMLDGRLTSDDKLKLDLKLDHNLVKPIKELKAHGQNKFTELDACTEADKVMGKCDRLGYPLKEDKTGEYLGKLTRDPVMILTDVASPGGTCVCYKNKCYCN